MFKLIVPLSLVLISCTSTPKAPAVRTYTLDTCVVMDSKLGSMGDPIVRVYNGQQVKFCAGTKAEETATIAARRRMLRRAIFEVYDFCKFSYCVVKKAREFLDEENKGVRITISSIFERKSLILANSVHVQATLCSTVAADFILLSSNHLVTVDSSLLFEHI